MRKSSISDGLGLTVDLLDFGARICNIDFNGSPLALGYDDIKNYLDDSFYLGASIGPIANRIAKGQLNINGEHLQMPCNEGANTLHSAGAGFDKQVWRVEAHSPNQICYSLDYDMTQVGLKGVLNTKAIYRVTDGSLTVKYRTCCDTTCYINLTNHVYLNLSGLANSNITEHQFEIEADSYAVVNEQNMPTGNLKPIDKPFAYALNNSPYPEFNGSCDHHFNVGPDEMQTVRTMFSAVSPSSGIKLAVSSNAPGFQFYTGKFLSAPFVSSAGFCVETQLAPNAINQAGFYAPLLKAGDEREQTTHFQFSQTQHAP